MRHTNFPRFVSLLIAIGINITLYSQTNKEMVILYNSKPVLAEVSEDGTINRIIKEMPDGLEGFTLKVFDYEKFLDEHKKEESNVIANQSYVVVSTDFQEIPFEKNFATLNNKAIDKLDDVINQLKSNPGAKILLRTLNKYDESLLNKNRVNSIRTYFKLNGISDDRVKYESLKGDINIDEVKIHFIR